MKFSERFHVLEQMNFPRSDLNVLCLNRICGALLVLAPVIAEAGSPPQVSNVSLQHRSHTSSRMTAEERAYQLNETAVGLVLKGDKAGGEAALREAARIDPNNPTVFYNLAGLYLNLGVIPKALEAVNRCVAIRPDDLSFLHRLGEIHFAAENFADAASVFELIAKQDPGFNEVLFHLGTVYAMQKRWEKAEEVLRRATELYPNQISVQTNLANVLIMRERFDEAVRLLEQIQQEQPSGEGALALGMAYDGAGQVDKAAAAYEVAKKLGAKDEHLEDRIADAKKRMVAKK